MLFKEFGHGTKKSQWSIGYEKQQQQRINQAQQNNGARANNPVQIIFPELEENVPLLPKSTIRLGNRVKIMNPTSGQLSEGREGPCIRRKPKNLEITSSPHNNENHH